MLKIILTSQTFEIRDGNNKPIKIHFNLTGMILTRDKQRVNLTMKQTKAMKDIFKNTNHIFNQF